MHTHRVTSPISGKNRDLQLQQRRNYLRNFWYAAALSQDLEVNQPKEVKMLGRTVALLRDDDGEGVLKGGLGKRGVNEVCRLCCKDKSYKGTA